MIRRIAVEAIEARVGRLLTEEEMTRAEILDSYLTLLEMAQRGERLCLEFGLRNRAARFAQTARYAMGRIDAL
jgi:hypothetical protein